MEVSIITFRSDGAKIDGLLLNLEGALPAKNDGANNQDGTNRNGNNEKDGRAGHFRGTIIGALHSRLGQVGRRGRDIFQGGRRIGLGKLALGSVEIVRTLAFHFAVLFVTCTAVRAEVLVVTNFSGLVLAVLSGLIEEDKKKNRIEKGARE